MVAAPIEISPFPGPRPRARLSLPLDVVRWIAVQENCELIQCSLQSNKASFVKHESACNSFVFINVWCANATVGIGLEHPRQGKMKEFCYDVDLELMREIFRNPRISAGYPTIKRSVQIEAFNRGNKVQVDGYGHLGEAEITDIEDEHGRMRILFGNGETRRANPSLLTKVHASTKRVPIPTGKCQSLASEEKLQMRRIQREMEKLQRAHDLIENNQLERRKIEARQLQDTHMWEGNTTEMNRAETPSPTSIAGSFFPTEGNEQMGLVDSSIELILQGSGAFASNSNSKTHFPPQPRESRLAKIFGGHNDSPNSNNSGNQDYSRMAMLPRLPPQGPQGVIHSNLARPFFGHNDRSISDNSGGTQGHTGGTMSPQMLPQPSHPSLAPPFCVHSDNRSMSSNSGGNQGHTGRAILPPLTMSGYFSGPCTM